MSDKPFEQAPRRIAMFIFDGCDIIDACGTLDVFFFANFWMQKSGRLATPAYSLSLIAEQAGPVQTSSGIRVVADHAIGENDDGIDTSWSPEARTSNRRAGIQR